MRVASMGELLIDFVAIENGVTVGEASGFLKAPGGAPANVAVAVARLGQEAAFLGQVGDDPFGHYLAEVLQAEAVNVAGLRYSQEARTMLAFVSLAADGERSFNFYRHPSADMLMTPADVATEVIADADIFHFGSITLITSPAKDATESAARFALEQNKLVSYDPNLRLNLWPDADAARAGMRDGLQFAHVAKISEEEVDLVLEVGETVGDLWGSFPNLRLLCLTHGGRGSTLYTRGGLEHFEAGFTMATVDTTGAGDAFVAGMLVSLLEQGLTTPDALEQVGAGRLLRFANASGALATTQRGAIPALPTYTQIQELLAR